MDPVTAFSLAHESLGICIKIGEKAKGYIDKYRAAVPDIKDMGDGVSIAYSTAIEFEKSLKNIPPEQLEQVIAVFDRLSDLFGGISNILSRYDDGKPIGIVKKSHWSFRGKDAADKLKREIEKWIAQVFPLVLTSLVRVGAVEVLVQQTEVLERVDGRVSELQEGLRELPGIRAGVEMLAVQQAMKNSSSLQRKVQVQTSWKPIVIDLSQSLEIPQPELRIEEESLLEGNYSFATVTFKSTEPAIPVILEHRPFDPESRLTVKSSIDQIARVISKVDPGIFNVPKCLGYFQESVDASRYSLILSRQFHINGVGTINATRFTLDDAISLFQTHRLSQQPLSKVQRALLQCLNDLESRTRLATDLIRALSYIHAVDCVHKSFRSDNIILCLDSKTSSVVPLIVGFHRARHINEKSDKKETLVWQNIIYRHPERWSDFDNKTFTPAHDDYSLGVVLLEIGLGKLARTIVHKENDASTSATALEAPADGSQRSARVVKTYLEQARLLQNKQGSTFSAVVKKCLELGIRSDGADEGFLNGLLEEMLSVKY
jgi:hypothetical protein